MDGGYLGSKMIMLSATIYPNELCGFSEFMTNWHGRMNRRNAGKIASNFMSTLFFKP